MFDALSIKTAEVGRLATISLSGDAVELIAPRGGARHLSANH